MTDEPLDPRIQLMTQIEEARDAGDTERAQELESKLYESFFDQYRDTIDERNGLAELADSSDPSIKAEGAKGHGSLDFMTKKFGEALRNYDNTTRLLNRGRRK